jgi:hypothetical protein
MRIEDWPVYQTSEFLAAYQLDSTIPDAVTITAGHEANRHSAGVAAVWDLAGRMSDARTMVLKTQERNWTAAGSILVEGRPGMNIGLLMPSLRGVPRLPAGALPMPRHDLPLHRALWALSQRLAQVELPRVLVVDAGDMFRIGAGPDGFRLEAGLRVEDIRGAFAAALQSGQLLRYSLETGELHDPGPVHPVTSLIGPGHDSADIVLADSSWPTAIPPGIGVAEIGMAMALVQRMQVAGCNGGSRLQVLDGSGASLVSVSRVDAAWTVTVPRPGV